MTEWKVPPQFVKAFEESVARGAAAFLPESTPTELARGLAGAFDSPSMHQFDSWTDADLYRAIAGEPHDRGYYSVSTGRFECKPDCGGCAAVAEYVAELNARGAARAAQARLEADVNAKYGIPSLGDRVVCGTQDHTTPARDGIFPADEA